MPIDTPLTINDHITLGGLIFAINPQSYSVKEIKLETHTRSRNGSLIVRYISDGAGGVKIKREFTFSTFTEIQLDNIKVEFKKIANLTFVDPYGQTFTVRPAPEWGYGSTGDNPARPDFSITLVEV